MALFGIIALVAAGMFAVFEGQSLVDGLWWTMVTLTTVGYGDLSPATAGGRMVAVSLMLTSIGIVSEGARIGVTWGNVCRGDLLG